MVAAPGKGRDALVAVPTSLVLALAGGATAVIENPPVVAVVPASPRRLDGDN